jgi:DNA-binding LacI/PurR family transcriptional regulator
MHVPRAKAPTIKDIAREAGVSIQTVSRVLNDHPDVAIETRQRVQALIERMGYQPNALARSMISQRTHTLGVIIPPLTAFGLQASIVELDQQALKHDYTLLISMVHDPQHATETKLVKDMLMRRVDGIIWFMTANNTEFNWKKAIEAANHIPIVSFTDSPSEPLVPVLVNELAGAKLATEHLLVQGYRHIGFISGPHTWSVSAERQLGWQQVLTEAGLPIRPNQITTGDWSAASGEWAMHQLLEQYAQIDAVFASNDQMALGAMRAIHRAGLTIPQKIGVVGFDNFPESDFAWPSLTTIQQPWAKKCEIVIQELARMIEESRERGSYTPPQTQILLPELIIRQSTARGG